MYRVIWSIVAAGTAPDATALSGAPAKRVRIGISMSNPPLAVSTVDCVAPQSDMTSPPKPNSRLRTVRSSFES